MADTESHRPWLLLSQPQRYMPTICDSTAPLCALACLGIKHLSPRQFLSSQPVCAHLVREIFEMPVKVSTLFLRFPQSPTDLPQRANRRLRGQDFGPACTATAARMGGITLLHYYGALSPPQDSADFASLPSAQRSLFARDRHGDRRSTTGTDGT